MSKQRKFTSRLDIEAAIIHCHRRIEIERKLAQKHEQFMKAHWDVANDHSIAPHTQNFNRTRGFAERKLRDRNLTNIRRLEDKKLPKLKHALASFRTDVFEFSKDDRSVVVN